MRCKKCEKTFRLPTKKMIEYQICFNCGSKTFPTKSKVKIGTDVQVKIAHGRYKGQLVNGIVFKILTPGVWHYEGLMVDLKSGGRGRVKKILSNVKVNAEKSDHTTKLDIDKINKLIKDAIILIRIRPGGIPVSALLHILSVTSDESKKLIPRLLRVDDIFQKEIVRDGIFVEKTLISDQSIEKSDQFVEKSKLDIRKECMHVIKYKRKIIDPILLREVILEYFELSSIKKVCEKHPWIEEKKIRRHLQTPKRLPKELQEKAHHLVSDPESSMSIVMYATDYFEWDGNINNEKNVVDFAIKLQKGFQENNDLRLMLLGKRIS